MKNKNSLFYTYREVAQIMNIGEQKARQLMKSEDFPSFKLGSRTLVSISDFNEWLENLAGKEIRIAGNRRKKKDK